MAVLKAEKLFRKAAKESAAGSDWEKLFSGLVDLAGDVASVESDLRKMRRRATPLPRPRKDTRSSPAKRLMTSRARP